MVFLNIYNKCCSILFKCMFFFDGFVSCGAFSEVYIGQFLWYFLLVYFPLRTGISPPWGDSIWSTEMHIPGRSCSSTILAPDPYVLGDVQPPPPRKHAEHLGMSSSLIVVKIEDMRHGRTNRIMGRKWMRSSRLCQFRRDIFAGVKLSVVLTSWWSSMLYALNLDMPLT